MGSKVRWPRTAAKCQTSSDNLRFTSYLKSFLREDGGIPTRGIRLELCESQTTSLALCPASVPYFLTQVRGVALDTVDHYRRKNEAERAAVTAWNRYAKLAQNKDASGEARLSAVREAIKADQEHSYAAQEWRKASGIDW